MNDWSLDKPLVSIVIVNYNGVAYTREAVLSILRHSPHSEIIIVDSCSTDDSVAALRSEFSAHTVLALHENKGFGFACNRGADAAKGVYLFFLNNDTVLSENTPAALSSFLEKNPAAGACGPKLLYQDGTFQLSFGLDPSLINEWIVRRWQHSPKGSREALMSLLERKYANANVDWVTGAALMVRTDLFRRLHGFDESFFMYFEDADICKRMRDLRYTVMYVPTTSLLHLRGQSAKDGAPAINVEYRRSQRYYYEKHRSFLARVILRLYLALRPVIQKI